MEDFAPNQKEFLKMHGCTLGYPVLLPSYYSANLNVFWGLPNLLFHDKILPLRILFLYNSQNRLQNGTGFILSITLYRSCNQLIARWI